jgi:NADP-dependent 3-hydroxy acid dehydrogenase YdfG
LNLAPAAAPAETRHPEGSMGERLDGTVALVTGAVRTELASHNRPEVLAAMQPLLAETELLHAEDVGDAIGYIVTRPRRVAVNELLVRPTEQEG